MFPLVAADDDGDSDKIHHHKQLISRALIFVDYLFAGGYIQWRRLHGARGHVPPTFTNG